MSGRPEPSRGVLAGIRNDLKRAKASGSSYDPRGAGTAWSHQFLNQKPWHPQNYRNQVKKFDAEQKKIADEKALLESQAEFNQEQEYLKTLSYLSAEEQQRYKERQSVSFMYMKPPGLDAALAREGQAAKEKAKEGSESEVATTGAEPGADASNKQKKGQGGRQAPSEADEERRRQLDRVREDPFAAMLQARRALESDVKFTLKEGPGIGAAHGGYDRQAENQQFLDDDDDGGQAGVGPSSSALAAAADGGCGGSMLLTEDSLALLMSLPHDERRKVLKQLKREQKERQRQAQLAEAEAVLRAAGIDTSSLQQASAGQDAREGKHKKRKHKKSKAKHKSRHDSSSGSDSSGDDSDSRQQAEARNERRHKPKKSKK